MNNTIVRSIALGAGVALVIIAAVFGWQYFSARTPIAKQEQVASVYQVPPPGEEYINESYGFSLTLPQGFVTREFENVVVIENEAGDGIQIVITPLDEDIPILTAERIHADVPDLVIREPEVVEVEEARTGLAFLSDNEAFDGASREVWFVFNMQLYQISTYAGLDPLLRSIFNSWEFF